MNSDYIQNLRFKLQKRVRRLNTVDPNAFHYSLSYFLDFLESHPMLCGILDDLVVRFPELAAKIEEAFERNGKYIANTEVELAAVSYILLRKWGLSDNPNSWIADGISYARAGNHTETLDKLRHLFLEPLYEYIDEQLDDGRAVLANLIRYKHRCEWFRRERLKQLLEDHSSKGEKLLSLDLYEYLHDQGLNFTIEPRSASGIPDLIAEQRTDDPLIADAKIFDPQRSKGKSYLIKGFNQVYTYTRDYNESFGYLVIFRNCEEDLKFDVSGTNASVPYVVHNGKTIFFIVIDICKYDASASRRGQARCIAITEQELVVDVDVEGAESGEAVGENVSDRE